MNENKKCLKSSRSANFGGGNFLSPRNEGLENGTAKPCHPEERSDVGIASSSKAAFTSPSRGMSEAKGEQESTETLSFRCDCERCRLMRGRKGRFAPQDDMVLKNLVVKFYRKLRSNNCFGA